MRKRKKEPNAARETERERDVKNQITIKDRKSLYK